MVACCISETTHARVFENSGGNAMSLMSEINLLKER